MKSQSPLQRGFVNADTAAEIAGFQTTGSLRNFVSSWNRENPMRRIRRLRPGYYHAQDVVLARQEFLQ